MRKIIAGLAFLGIVGLATTASAQSGGDEPPTRNTEAPRTQYDGHRHGYGHHRHGRHGGCCGRQRDYDCHRDHRCCDEGYGCGACRDGRCTMNHCHRNGEPCAPCAEWVKKQSGDDVYRRR